MENVNELIFNENNVTHIDFFDITNHAETIVKRNNALELLTNVVYERKLKTMNIRLLENTILHVHSELEDNVSPLIENLPFGLRTSTMYLNLIREYLGIQPSKPTMIDLTELTREVSSQNLGIKYEEFSEIAKNRIGNDEYIPEAFKSWSTV